MNFNLIRIIFVCFFVFTSKIHASESFRLNTGEIIYVGMTKLELFNIAGTPNYTENTTSTNQYDDKNNYDSQTLYFKLTGDIGGEYTIFVKLKKEKITQLEVIQLDR